MNLIELLNKRNKKEDLTEEELAFLNQYDESIAVHLAELETAKAQADDLKAKMENMDSELQDKNRILTEKQLEVETLTTEKGNYKKIIEESESTTEARKAVERMKAEREKSEAIKEAEKEKARIKAESDLEKQKATEELENLKNKIAFIEFEKNVNIEKNKRPYMAKLLDKILVELPVKGLKESEIGFKYLLDVFNHDEEMIKWEASQVAGTDIFTKTKVEIKETEEKKDPKYGKLNVDLAKKYGLIGR